MTDFIRVSVEQLNATSRHYLAEAARRTPASTDRIEITLEIAKKYGEIYEVYKSGLIGCIYVLTYNTKEGKVLSPVLVGGKDMGLWQQDLYDFLVAEAKKLDAVAIRFIARKGWGKLYPMCRNIGTIYEWKPARNDV